MVESEKAKFLYVREFDSQLWAGVIIPLQKIKIFSKQFVEISAIQYQTCGLNLFGLPALGNRSWSIFVFKGILSI